MSLIRRELEDVEKLAPLGVKKGTAACIAQGLEPGAVKCLSVSIYLGKSVDMGMLEALEKKYVFGADPKQCQLVTMEVKAKGTTFPMLWDSKEVEPIENWFSDLIRNLNEAGYSTESAIVGSFKSRTLETFGKRPKALVQYLKQYFDQKHTGRGIPTPFDEDIAWRLKGGESDDLSDIRKDVKSVKKDVDRVANENATLKTKLEQAKAEIKALKSEKSNSNNEAEPKEKKFRGKCNLCGKWGHKEKDCPMKETEEEVEDE